MCDAPVLWWQELHPGDLKSAVEHDINELLAPIRKTFDTPEMKKLINLAYPVAGNKHGKSGINDIILCYYYYSPQVQWQRNVLPLPLSGYVFQL